MRHSRMFCLVVLAASLFVAPFVSVTVAQCASAGKAKSQKHNTAGTCNPTFNYTDQDAWTGECNNGKWQTPINISAPLVPSLPGLSFTGYKTGPATIFNDCNHHRILVNLPSDDVNRSTFTYGGRTYWLKEFHFHQPAENTIFGSRPQAMEVHLVHETIDDPKLTLVVAVLVAAGQPNGLINTLWPQIPIPGLTLPVSGAINAASLLPNNKAYYLFTGSLTTPPCTPGVTWIVLKEPGQFSQGQIDYYMNHYRGTARRLQPVVRQSP